MNGSRGSVGLRHFFNEKSKKKIEEIAGSVIGYCKWGGWKLNWGEWVHEMRGTGWGSILEAVYRLKAGLTRAELSFICIDITMSPPMGMVSYVSALQPFNTQHMYVFTNKHKLRILHFKCIKQFFLFKLSF